MSFAIKLYLLTIPVFFAIDMIWLGGIAPGFYRKHIGFIMAERVNWTAAILFYLIFIAGILIFAVYPALAKGAAGHALLLGVLFGLVTYATYDLTNLATLKDWPVIVVVVDIIWGMLLCGIVATTSFYIGGWLAKIDG